MRYINYIIITLFIFSCTGQNNTSPSKSENQILDSIEYEKITKTTNSELIESKFKPIDFVNDSSANTLISLYNRIHQDDSTKINELEYKYFKTFPSNFKTYQSLFGYIDSEPMPLYGENGENMVSYFYNISSIDINVRINKYFDIAEGGIWGADCEQDFVIGKLLISDTDILCKILSQRTDNNIKSILRFVYDGPHPENPDALNFYHQGLDSVKKYDLRIADLMEQTYNDLLQRSDGQGH